MRLRQMEVFRAVMLTGSINGAAKMLFVSQPAVSRLVAYTEQSLGLKLFHRTRGKLIPTPEGEALFREVDDCYQHAMRVSEFAAALARGPSGTLNICASPCLSYSIVPDAIGLFSRRYPRISINLHTTLLENMPSELLSNNVDLVISVMPLEHPNLMVQPFRRGKMVCVFPDGHELSSLKTVDFSDLARYPLISHHGSMQFGKMVNTAMETAGLQLTPHIRVRQTHLACSLAQSGAGVAIVDEYTATGGPWKGLQIRPLTHEIRLAPSIARSIFERHRTHADKFVETLIDAAQHG